MNFNKYYQDELSYLRELGQEFARAYPSAGQFLADRGSDPDVERLLEGFAFLTGRIRQKLDDEFPEIIHEMMNLLWPHYMRPIPSMAMIEFSPITGVLRDMQKIPRKTKIDSVLVEGTPCHFQTCFEIDLLPIIINDIILENPAGDFSRLRLQFKSLGDVKISQLFFDRLRLHLFGEPAYLLYLWLCRYVKDVTIVTGSQTAPQKHLTMSPSIISPAGLDDSDALIPYPQNSFEGYRLIQEYFTFPQKFLFIEISELSNLQGMGADDSFEIIIRFSRPLQASTRITRDNIRINCTPAINIFSMESDPIRITHDKAEYLIRPDTTNPQHYEIYSVDRVKGWVQGSAAEHNFEPFYSFKHSLSQGDKKDIYYQTHLRKSVIGDGRETYISFRAPDRSSVLPQTEIVMIELTCTNRTLANELKVDDINVPTSDSPEFATFRNITKVTDAVSSPFGGDTYWRLLSHLSLNHLSLSNVHSLRAILSLYNFQGIYDHHQAGRANKVRLEGIQGIKTDSDSILINGSPVRGISAFIELQEDKFSGEGDMYLFASILNEFLALYVSINSFAQLTVKGVQQGEIYKWRPSTGEQMIL